MRRARTEPTTRLAERRAHDRDVRCGDAERCAGRRASSQSSGAQQRRRLGVVAGRIPEMERDADGLVPGTCSDAARRPTESTPPLIATSVRDATTPGASLKAPFAGAPAAPSPAPAATAAPSAVWSASASQRIVAAIPGDPPAIPIIPALTVEANGRPRPPRSRSRPLRPGLPSAEHRRGVGRVERGERLAAGNDGRAALLRAWPPGNTATERVAWIDAAVEHAARPGCDLLPGPIRSRGAATTRQSPAVKLREAHARPDPDVPTFTPIPAPSDCGRRCKALATVHVKLADFRVGYSASAQRETPAVAERIRRIGDFKVAKRDRILAASIPPDAAGARRIANRTGNVHFLEPRRGHPRAGRGRALGSVPIQPCHL